MKEKIGEMQSAKQGKPMKVNVGHSTNHVLLVMEPCPGCGTSVIAELTVEMSMKVREMLEATEHKLQGTIILQ